MSDPGHLAENVLHFARLLRAAGLPVGTDRPLLALRALELAGIDSRADLRTVLEACLIDRFEHRALFEQAFLAFFRSPEGLSGSAAPPSSASHRQSLVRTPASRRLAQALWPERQGTPPAPPPQKERTRHEDLQPSASDRERLRRADFDTMTAAEWIAATRAAASFTPLLKRAPTRREAPAAHGRRIDPRRLLRDCARRGGEVASLPRRQHLTRLEPLVAMVDISGSMSRYSRMFLHFLHALVNGSQRARARAATPVAAFVFGTRLTPITRALRARDPDDALSRVTRSVPDFSGGTRIGACLREFNRLWAKRLPLAEATVLLVTDGLERSEVEPLEREAAHLARSCRRLIWLNPLLRYDAFEPRARGVRALLPHVDQLLAIHNLESLERLAEALSDKTWK
ncbi:MAG TPA: VWA domain-containing protein [Steroidobacteraceae bacterium]|nr:VWA domain-containing protein [Steroidobacteraceae bacterium]